MSGKPRLTAKKKKQMKEKLCDLLRKSPIIEIACQKVGISRMTLSRWRRDDPAFSQKIEEALEISRESINDLAESKMIQMISEGNASMIRFWSIHNNSRYKCQPNLKQNHFYVNQTPLSKEFIDAMVLALPKHIIPNESNES